MPSFSQLRASAEERWKPEEGGEYTVCAVDVRIGETKNGYPSISLWLEVIDQGPDSGERFWDGTYLSASKRANNMAFAKLESASTQLNEAFWAQEPDDGSIISALMGSKLKVRTTFEVNERDPENPWLRCTYIPLEEADIETDF